MNEEINKIYKIAPKCLKEAIDKFVSAREQYKTTNDWSVLEWPYCELQSEINCAEIDGCISPAAAGQLREEFL